MAKKTSKKIRTVAVRARKPAASARPTGAKASPAGSKLDRIVAALRAPKGASVPDLMKLTGWQAHSVRGAMSGALKKDRGLAISSDKQDGERIYRIKG